MKIGVNIDRQDFSGKIKYEIKHESPIAPLKDYAAFMRGKEEWAGKARRGELQPMCALGPVEVLQIKAKHNLDVYNLRGNDGKALAFVIETEYPHLKTTNKKVYRTGGQKGQQFS